VVKDAGELWIQTIKTCRLLEN